MIKILFLTNIPSPYRINFFNLLGNYCDLTVVFEKKSSYERDSSWENFKITNFKAIFLRGIETGVDSSFCPSIIKTLNNQNYDHIVVSNFSSFTGLLAIFYMKYKGISYEIESDGGFLNNKSNLKEAIKTWVMSDAKICFSTSKSHDLYYLKYGVKKDRIIRYPFTSLFQNDILGSVVTSERKIYLKNKLGIKEKNIVISVGQFIKRKGFDLLIKASDNFIEDTGVYIIGGSPTEEYLQLISKHNKCNIHFLGFKQKNELYDYLQAADLFVFPTREDIWGLVINEAMANALPIVTTDKCVAGLELVNETNGVIIPANSIKKIYENVNKILCNDSMKTEMSSNSLNKISNYTLENMVLTHLDVWNNRNMHKS